MIMIVFVRGAILDLPVCLRVVDISRSCTLYLVLSLAEQRLRCAVVVLIRVTTALSPYMKKIAATSTRVE
jgi:hypothetical protein